MLHTQTSIADMRQRTYATHARRWGGVRTCSLVMILMNESENLCSAAIPAPPRVCVRLPGFGIHRIFLTCALMFRCSGMFTRNGGMCILQ